MPALRQWHHLRAIAANLHLQQCVHDLPVDVRIDHEVTPSVFESLLERGHNLRSVLDLRQPPTEDDRRAVHPQIHS